MPKIPEASSSQWMIFLALMGIVVAYCVLVLFDARANPLDTLETILLLLAGALAGVSAPRSRG